MTVSLKGSSRQLSFSQESALATFSQNEKFRTVVTNKNVTIGSLKPILTVNSLNSMLKTRKLLKGIETDTLNRQKHRIGQSGLIGRVSANQNGDRLCKETQVKKENLLLILLSIFSAHSCFTFMLFPSVYQSNIE